MLLLIVSSYKLTMLYYSLFVVTPNEIGSLFLSCGSLCPFWSSNNHAEEERAGCLTLFCGCLCFGLFLKVPWVGL